MRKVHTENGDREAHTSRVEGMTMSDHRYFIIEVEIQGVRSFMGPFPSLVTARTYADEHVNRTMIHILRAPDPLAKIDPNQTTIEEHIDAVHDHVG